MAKRFYEAERCGRSFDSVSRDKAARDSAQDDGLVDRSESQ